MEYINPKALRFKKLKYKILVVIVSVCCSVALAELFLSFFLPQRTWNQLKKRAQRTTNRPSNILPYELRPNSTGTIKRREFHVDVHINSHGYRGNEFDFQKGEKFRILVIGDSFTFGWGVSDKEAYPQVLESQLKEELDKDCFQVINAGFAAGYSPDTYYLYLKEVGLKLRPDLILVGFSIGNDLDHNESDENRWVKVDEDGLPLKIENRYVIWEDGVRYGAGKYKSILYKIPILRNSHLFHGVLSRLKKLKRWRNPGPTKKFNKWIYRKNYLERTNEIVRKTNKLLLAMSGLAKDNRIPIVIVMIPAIEQIFPDRYPFQSFSYMEDCDLEKPQKILIQFLNREQIFYLDLLPLFKQERPEPPLYFEIDHHWTRHGHQAASRIIADYLIRNEIIALKKEGDRAPGGNQPELCVKKKGVL